MFGDLPLGAGTVEKFQLQSDLLRVDIISWGCTITALEVKDRQGRASDVVLGFAELEGGLNSALGRWLAPRPLRTRPRGGLLWSRDPGEGPELGPSGMLGSHYLAVLRFSGWKKTNWKQLEDLASSYPLRLCLN